MIDYSRVIFEENVNRLTDYLWFNESAKDLFGVHRMVMRIVKDAIGITRESIRDIDAEWKS